jgi:hypothetical protein
MAVCMACCALCTNSHESAREFFRLVYGLFRLSTHMAFNFIQNNSHNSASSNYVVFLHRVQRVYPRWKHVTKRSVSALLLLLPAAAVVATGLGALEIRSHLILSAYPYSHSHSHSHTHCSHLVCFLRELCSFAVRIFGCC